MHRTLKKIIFIGVALLASAYVLWSLLLPRYLIVESGMAVSISAPVFFQCINNAKNWQKWGGEWNHSGIHLKKNDQIALANLSPNSQLWTINSLVENEYVALQTINNQSFSISIEDNDPEIWLQLKFESNLGPVFLNRPWYQMQQKTIEYRLQNMMELMKSGCLPLESTAN